MIPLQFILSKVSLEWPDALWGQRHGLLTTADLVALAHFNLDRGSTNDLEMEAANIEDYDHASIIEIVERLASEQEYLEDHIRKKWIFISLAWDFETKDALADPLGAVEDIYADFDYPVTVESFVRYMPCGDGHDPTRHSSYENNQRLMQKWEEFIRSGFENIDA